MTFTPLQCATEALSAPAEISRAHSMPHRGWEKVIVIHMLRKSYHLLPAVRHGVVPVDVSCKFWPPE
jgi:hypothetical protein